MDKSVYSSGLYDQKVIASYHKAMQDYTLETWWERVVIV